MGEVELVMKLWFPVPGSYWEEFGKRMSWTRAILQNGILYRENDDDDEALDFGVPYFQISSNVRDLNNKHAIFSNTSRYLHTPTVLWDRPAVWSSMTSQLHRPGYVGVSINGGTPQWMVYIMENTVKMDDLGVALQETSIYPSGQMFRGSPDFNKTSRARRRLSGPRKICQIELQKKWERLCQIECLNIVR